MNDTCTAVAMALTDALDEHVVDRVVGLATMGLALKWFQRYSLLPMPSGVGVQRDGMAWFVWSPHEDPSACEHVQVTFRPMRMEVVYDDGNNEEAELSLPLDAPLPLMAAVIVSETWKGGR